MARLPVSLIVVSRHRPEALARAIRAVGQQDHDAVELVIVADPGACERVRAAGVVAKVIAFDTPNISAARNLGLAAASGAVVAFLDDDAVPEPTWLSRLTAPFAEPEVMAATGFVLGRNGISWQWQAVEVDATGADHPLPVSAGVSLHQGTSARAVKTQGSNCAFRRDPLLAAGGFDPGYRFYLDEADVNLRLAPLGKTAVVPDAVVHHGYAASARRRADRAPLSLHEVGASSAVFLRRHAPSADHQGALDRLRQDQRRRALRLMVDGRIEPRDVRRLLATLESGIAEGQARVLGPLQPIPTARTPFLRLSGTGPRPGRVIAGWRWQAATCRRAAAAAVANGEIVTLFLFGPGTRRHRHAFDAEGYWIQTGGVAGMAQRNGLRLRLWTLRQRVAEEAARVAVNRPVVA